MTCNLVVHSGAWPDMTWPIGSRPAVAAYTDRGPAHADRRRSSGIAVSRRLFLLAADLDRAAATIPRVAGTLPRGFMSRSAGCNWTKGFLAKRASRCASNSNEDGLPCRGTSWLIALPYKCGGLARKRDLRWIARRYDITGAPALSVS
ncbi:MAG: hypothetical protein OXL68_16245 [Paracoccaceae bacterium]|nr:hypothetical protein [Paracoccaceae bacterium]